MVRIHSRIWCVLPWPMLQPSTKSHKNQASSFSTILLTDRQTNKPNWKHNLLGGGNNGGQRQEGGKRTGKNKMGLETERGWWWGIKKWKAHFHYSITRSTNLSLFLSCSFHLSPCSNSPVCLFSCLPTSLTRPSISPSSPPSLSLSVSSCKLCFPSLFFQGKVPLLLIKPRAPL